MIRLCLAMLVLLVGVALSPPAATADVGVPAAAHEHATAHEHAATGQSDAKAVAAATKTVSPDPHRHPPGTQGCRFAAGCSGMGSVTYGVPSVALPRWIVTTLMPVTDRTPRGIDLPLEDRPPRSV